MPPPINAVRTASADTIRAIRQLYANRRSQAAAIGFGGTALLMGSGVMFGSVQAREGKGLFTAGDYAFIGGFLSIVPWAWGGLTASDFSARQEAKLIQRYEAGEPLPQLIRRKLKPRYFRP